jgi:hypothetical protein
MKARPKNQLPSKAAQSGDRSEETFEDFEAREDVRAVFVKIQKSKSFTRKAAEEAFAHVEVTKK